MCAAVTGGPVLCQVAWGPIPPTSKQKAARAQPKGKAMQPNKYTLGAAGSDDEGIVPVGPTGHLLHKVTLSRPRGVADLPPT